MCKNIHKTINYISDFHILFCYILETKIVNNLYVIQYFYINNLITNYHFQSL